MCNIVIGLWRHSQCPSLAGLRSLPVLGQNVSRMFEAIRGQQVFAGEGLAGDDSRRRPVSPCDLDLAPVLEVAVKDQQSAVSV